MASPQEAIERAIPHPADSTPESRRAASSHVLRALAANDYGFIRRPHLINQHEDGQCPHCLCEMVHVDHGPTYMDAFERMNAMQAQLDAYYRALVAIASGDQNPVALAKAVIG